MNTTFEEEFLIGTRYPRPKQRSLLLFRTFVVSTLSLLFLSHSMLWMGIGMYWNQVMNMIDELSSIGPEIQEFLSEAERDLDDLSSLAVFIENNMDEITKFIDNLSVIDEAAQCTLSTLECNNV